LEEPRILRELGARHFFVERMQMSGNERVLVRCAACKGNFETAVFGHQKCRRCGADLFLDPPPGVLSEEGEACDGNSREESAPLPEPDQGTPGPWIESSGEIASEPGTPEEAEVARVQVITGLIEYVPPWESGKNNLPKRFFKTVKEELAFPAVFFGQMRVQRPWRALVFGWILCTTAILFFGLYFWWKLQFDQEALIKSLRAGMRGEDGLTNEYILQSVRDTLSLLLILSPVLGFLNVVLSACLHHVGVMLIAKEHRGFGATLRATAYGFSPMLLSGIPMIGYLLGWFWTVILQIVAIANIHRTTSWRAVGAVLLPELLFFLLLWKFLPQF
jgi:hypothetical protein